MVDARSGAQFFRASHGIFVFSSCALLLFGCGYAGTPPVPKVVVVISPASATVALGQTQQFQAAVTGSTNTVDSATGSASIIPE
jgi:uncharacterized protein YjdB